jgi:hypothetical protein
VPLALGIGITDDWLDFRGLARAAAAASNTKHSTD